MIENNIIGRSKPGIQKKKFQKLKKGDIDIIFEIDLHGKTIIESENFLDIWLPRLQMENKLSGIIIHGKGYGSGAEGPKLKKFVDQYLQYNPNILAYHSAQQKDGGTGAVYILLKNIN
jgi:DNA-nicking Smr family endonuclease